MNAKSNQKLSDLPDEEFEGYKSSFKARPIKICKTHSKWMVHTGYIDNHDGTISCKFCPWGARTAGYMKVKDGRIIDLRSVTRE